MREGILYFKMFSTNFSKPYFSHLSNEIHSFTQKCLFLHKLSSKVHSFLHHKSLSTLRAERRRKQIQGGSELVFEDKNSGIFFFTSSSEPKKKDLIQCSCQTQKQKRFLKAPKPWPVLEWPPEPRDFSGVKKNPFFKVKMKLVLFETRILKCSFHTECQQGNIKDEWFSMLSNEGSVYI